MILKVVNGTRSNQKRLCDTCSSSVIMRGASGREEVAFCHELRRHIPIQVMECNRCKEDGRPSLWDMREIAWVLNVDSRRQKLGFQSATQWKREHDGEEVVADYLLD